MSNDYRIADLLSGGWQGHLCWEVARRIGESLDEAAASDDRDKQLTYLGHIQQIVDAAIQYQEELGALPDADSVNYDEQRAHEQRRAAENRLRRAFAR